MTLSKFGKKYHRPFYLVINTVFHNAVSSNVRDPYFVTNIMTTTIICKVKLKFAQAFNNFDNLRNLNSSLPKLSLSSKVSNGTDRQEIAGNVA